MSNKIINIGSIQHLDDEGYVINDLSIENIQKEYAVILKDVLRLYQKYFSEHLHSIYLRGSVAKGMAIPNVSDLDTIAVSKTKLSQEEIKIRELIWEEIAQKYPYLKGVEIHFEALETVHTSKRLQFLLKTQCICVYGTNLNLQIPKLGLGKYAYAHSPTFEEDLERVSKWLETEDSDEEKKEVCSWIMKRTVRIGFELVMKRERCFTRDLYPCYERFAKHYPKKSSAMYEALTLAVFPTANTVLLLQTIAALKDFLLKEISVQF